MNKKPEEFDEQIDRFLQAEEDGRTPNFSNANLAREIISLNNSEKGRSRLIPFLIAGLAACVAFVLLSPFGAPSELGDSLTSLPLVKPVEPLLDSDKELLVDLLAMPQEMNWGEALPDEATLDLLVMLDQSFE
jgi:hypothetical protein